MSSTAGLAVSFDLSPDLVFEILLHYCSCESRQRHVLSIVGGSQPCWLGRESRRRVLVPNYLWLFLQLIDVEDGLCGWWVVHEELYGRLIYQNCFCIFVRRFSSTLFLNGILHRPVCSLLHPFNMALRDNVISVVLAS